ncbi:hypothetical protein NDU88_002209 [Pleurodeles waltl]|uniref:Uncharacterized protein n=1 Tax=Pleurodeles waltl TaxID=8319 RepID=A0AAV7KYA4_PLEWA|nr:hypothetical protein NDU88_002209 [Pleurodeles waltl]
MDPRGEEAMRLLKEAGRLDLLADGEACRERPARQASRGVAAAVAACSPPRSGGQRALQVRRGGSGRGRAGRVGAPSRRGAADMRRRPGPLGAQPLDVLVEGGAEGGTGAIPAAAPKRKGFLGRGPRSLWARPSKRGLSAGARVGDLMYCRLEQVQAETENEHMTDENGWDENRTRQTHIGRGWTVAGLRR